MTGQKPIEVKLAGKEEKTFFLDMLDLVSNPLKYWESFTRGEITKKRMKPCMVYFHI